MSDAFKWDMAQESGSLVFPSAQGLAIYRNPAGDVVLRQEAAPTDEDDTFIFIPVMYVEAVIEAIRRAAKGTVGEAPEGRSNSV